MYKKLISKKRKAKLQNQRCATVQNSNLLRDCHINCYKRYNILKEKIYNDLLINTRGNNLHFYKFMRTKRRVKTSIPPMLIRDGTKYFGNDTFRILAKQLTSSFADSATDFSQDHNVLYQQLEQIYDSNYSTLHHSLWQTYSSQLQSMK